MVSGETQKADAELKKINQTLNELMSIVLTTFKRIGCSQKMLEELIGLDTNITPRNLIVYLRTRLNTERSNCSTYCTTWLSRSHFTL